VGRAEAWVQSSRPNGVSVHVECICGLGDVVRAEYALGEREGPLLRIQTNKQTNSVAFSPRANCTD
jgi:hypothetical protein